MSEVAVIQSSSPSEAIHDRWDKLVENPEREECKSCGADEFTDHISGCNSNEITYRCFDSTGQNSTTLQEAGRDE